MKSIHELTRVQAEQIGFVLTDIDDTLTKEGKLLPEAYTALWSLQEEGIEVIPVTGRPAGWCDLIARQWPVAGVVGENGALAYYSVNEHLERMYHPEADLEAAQNKLDVILEAVLSRVEGTRVAKDQFSRLFDLAIDFAEEEPRLPIADAEKIKSICEEFGAKAKISSIHVNTWFGEYDKLGMALVFLKERRGLESEDAQERVMYFGDSPNDVPMFSFFPLSCGVGNIRQWSGLLDRSPAFVTDKWYGEGFAEATRRILALRRSR